jgi:hypothetical protein
VTIITKSASADALKSLLHFPKDTMLTLSMKRENWLAVTDEIRQGHCNVQTLGLSLLQGTPFEATEAAQAVASVIQLDRNLKTLSLRMGNVFTEKAGMALADALTVNKSLRKIVLSVKRVDASTLPNTAALGVPV